MGISTDKPRYAAHAVRVVVKSDTLAVELVDGRTVEAPIAWYPRLLHGTPPERSRWRLIGEGEGIHWPALDEDISVEGLLAGRPSAESQTSLRRWLAARQAKRSGPALERSGGKPARRKAG
jgi:uncharacterized protein DUF2442